MIQTLSCSSRRAVALLAALTLVAAGCGDSGADPDGGLPFNEALISAAGGTIDLDGKGRVEIPAGALSTDTTIRIQEADRTRLGSPTPDRTRAAGSALALTPHGTSFTTPVRVRIETGTTTNRVRVYRLSDEDDTKWKLVRGEEQSPDRTRVEVRVSKFSVYSAFEAETPSDCGPFDDDDDGVGDFCDVCDYGDDGQDSDGDGVPDACDNCPLMGETDGPQVGECALSIGATYDTYVDEGLPDDIYGDSTLIRVADTMPQRIGHIRFDTSISCVAALTAAELIIPSTGASMGTMDEVAIHEQDACCWSEASANWANGPNTVGAQIETVPNSELIANGELRTSSATFLQTVQNQHISSCGVINLSLVSTSGTAEFASKEDMVTPPAALNLTAVPYQLSYIQPSDDSYVDPTQAGTNFGSEVQMIAGANGAADTDVRYIYMKFDLQSFGCCGVVADAALEMTLDSGELYGGSDGTITAEFVSDNTWNEGAITFMNAPAPDPMTDFPLWRVSDPGRGDEQTRAVFNGDLRNHVQNAIDDDGYLSLRLTIPDGWHGYFSRNAADALRPRLRIMYDDFGGG